MAHQLIKGQPGFEVVTGEMKGHKFEPGKKYKKIPDKYRNRFVQVKVVQAVPVQIPVPEKAKGDKS
jgi:hypothetical protein